MQRYKQGIQLLENGDHRPVNGSSDASAASRLRSAAFGPVSDAVRDGRVGRSEALLMMERAVRALYPDCSCAFGHGSALTGTYSAYSDCDVVVFVDKGNFFEARCVNFDGYLIEAQVYTFDVLDIFMAISRAAGLSIGMMAGRGEVLVDRDGRADALRQRLSDAFHAGPDPAADHVLATLRMKLTNQIVDLLDARHADERIACGLALFDLMNKAKFTTLGVWHHAGKWVPRSIRARDPEYFPNLIAAYGDLLQGDAAPLASAATKLLDAMGGALWAGYQARIAVMPDLVTGGALAAAATLART